MRVLWIAPRAPVPSEGTGAAHQFELLKKVAAHHDVMVLMGSRLPPGPEESALSELGVAFERVGWERQPIPSTLRHALNLLVRDSATVFWATASLLAALSAASKRVEEDFRPDIVQVTLGELAPLLGGLRSPTGLFLMDVYSRWIESRLAVSGRMREKVHWTVQLAKMRRWERQWFPRATGVACVSDQDARALHRLGLFPRVVPNPVAEDYFAVPETEREQAVVLFVGSLDYAPNIDAVKWLTSRIWPVVRQAHPEAVLRVVGRVVSDDVQRVVESSGGTVYADVPDVRPYYWGATVCVAPVRMGAGVRNKVLHALATFTPTVATSMAAEGIPIEHGRHALIADDEASFAQAVVALLEAPERRSALASQGRLLAEQFRSEQAAVRLEEWWSVIRSRAARA